MSFSLNQAARARARVSLGGSAPPDIPVEMSHARAVT
jgi:hypothetical protein